MRFLKLRMRNFRPFFGLNEVDLSTPGASNLIVVFGENMRGKTALLNAIRWALYGSVLTRRGQPVPIFRPEGGGEQLLNSLAAEAGTFEMEVDLDFEHDGSTYSLRRVASAVDGPAAAQIGFKLETFLQVDGSAVAETDVDARIGRILNEEVSRFSLFDGEMLNEYEKLLADDEDEVRAVRGAIEKILGLPALTRGKVHLETLLKEAQRELNSAVRKESKYKEAADKFEEFEDAVASKERELGNLSEKHRQAEENLEGAKNSLREIEQFNYTFSLMASLEGQIDSASSALENYQMKIRDVLATSWWVPLTGRISRLRNELDERVEEEIKSRRQQVEREQAKRSLASGECVLCEQPIGDDVRVTLDGKAEQSEAATASTEDQDLMGKLLSAKQLVASLDGGRQAQIVASSADGIMQYETEIEEKRVQVVELRGDLGGISKGDQQKKMRSFESAEEDCQRLSGEITRIDKELADLKADRDSEAAKMGRFDGVDPEVRRRFVLADLLVRAFDAAIGEFRERAREIVSTEADQIFTTLISEEDYSGLRITKNYGLRILDSRGNQLPGRSAGAEHIVALSLIGGLNRSAVGGHAPLVMDTNFGRLDKSHRENVVSFVGSLDQQVILLVHSGELDEDDLDRFGIQCARKYRIEKLSEWESEVVPV